MKKISIIGLVVLQIGMVQADDGFYTRAMCISRDGSFDPGEPARFEPTIGFQTHPVRRFSKKEKRSAQLQKDRTLQAGDGKVDGKKKITVQNIEVKNKSKK